MRRMLFAVLAVAMLSSYSGCCCFHQFLCCMKQKFCCCHDPVCGPPGKCCPPVCCPNPCGPGCGPSSCATGGCGDLYVGDVGSMHAGKNQPCNNCGQWVGKSYPGVPSHPSPMMVESGRPMPAAAAQAKQLRPTPANQPQRR